MFHSAHQLWAAWPSQTPHSSMWVGPSRVWLQPQPLELKKVLLSSFPSFLCQSAVKTNLCLTIYVQGCRRFACSLIRLWECLLHWWLIPPGGMTGRVRMSVEPRVVPSVTNCLMLSTLSSLSGHTGCLGRTNLSSVKMLHAQLNLLKQRWRQWTLKSVLKGRC